MELNHEQLFAKLLDFWNKYDCQEISVTELKKNFNHYELAVILYDSHFYEEHYNIVAEFKKKIFDLKGLFTEDEAMSAIRIIQYPEELFKYLSSDKLFSLVSEDDYIMNDRIAQELTLDEDRIKFYDMMSDNEIREEIVCNFDSDELKLKYLKEFDIYERTSIITSIKNESLREKFIGFFTAGKGRIIATLTSDEKKKNYFKKYFRILSNDDKSYIISSFSNKEDVIEYLKMCNDEVKSDIATEFRIEKDFQDRIIGMLSGNKAISNLLKNYCNNIHEDLIFKYIEYVKDKDKIEIIGNLHKTELKFKLLKFVENKKLLPDIIEHTDTFPEYNSEYDYIVDLYANEYQLNKENLLYLVSNISFSILQIVENPNIQKIINLAEEDFIKVVKLFDKEQLKMNSSTMNDLLNTLLQRTFRVNGAEIILLFPNMLNAIENKDKDFILTKISELSQTIDIKEELLKNDWSLYEFINLLLYKDELAIDILHNLTTKYITKKRNQYIQENIHSAIQEVTITRYINNDLMKYMLDNYPVELISSYFHYMTDIDSEKTLTEEELQFIKNKELIKEIILYKKNPNDYEQIPNQVKNNLKMFNYLFEKLVASHSCNSFPDIVLNKKKCEFKPVDSQFIVDILMNLDIECLQKNLFANSLVFEKFLKIWNQYKIGGWGSTFEKLLVDASITISPEVIANFIQYFGLSYETIEEKIEKGELSNMSLTALLDLASSYSSNSKKYSMIFGKEDFKYIVSNPGPNASVMLKEDRIKKELEYLKLIKSRKYVTVPPIDKDFTLKSGKKMNIVVGNFSNIINLTYGERTGSCMRVGGAGKTLFDFCLENESGFHIRFSNPDNKKFVSRVSGFRNGNTVFLNQLRYSQDKNYSNTDVVEACKLISEELINLSKESNVPIDNVVITPYYAMKESGMEPKNLDIDNPQKGMKKFYTDVGSSSIILATTDENNELVTPKLGMMLLPKYSIIRDKQKTFYNKDSQEYVTHLKVLDQFLSGFSPESIVAIDNENIIMCLAGEDWYVSLDKEGNVENYVMKNSNNIEEALKEMENALSYVKENVQKETTISNNISLGM